MQINHRQIEAFRSVYQTNSMTMAAELMSISQPAVSRLIKDFEAEIGFQLFERQHNKLVSTAAASRLYHEVQRSYRGLDKISEVASQLSQNNSDDLSIAATAGTSFFLLPDVLMGLTEQHPGLNVNLHTGPSPEVSDLVARQQYDIGFAVIPEKTPGVQTQTLPELNALCLFHPGILQAGKPLQRRPYLAPKDLANYPLMMIADYSLMQQQIQHHLKQAKLSYDIVLQSSYSVPLAELAKQQRGIAILDPLTALAYKKNHPELSVKPFYPHVKFRLTAIRSSLQSHSANTQRLIDAVTLQLSNIGKDKKLFPL